MVGFRDKNGRRAYVFLKASRLPIWAPPLSCRGAPSAGFCSAAGGALAAFPFFFFLVLALQLPQQRPRDNHGQGETHEKAKDDINRGHKTIAKTPPSDNKRTPPPIIAATTNTFLLSKSPAITTPTLSYSASTLSTHEVPPKSRTPLPDLSGFRQDNPCGNAGDVAGALRRSCVPRNVRY